MVIADTPVQCLDQCGAFLSSGALSKVGEFLRVGLPINECAQNRAAALTEDVRQDAAQFQIRILQDLLDARRVLGDFPHQLLSGAGEIAQLLDRCRRHEA